MSAAPNPAAPPGSSAAPDPDAPPGGSAAPDPAPPPPLRPLAGLEIVELGGIGPAPFAGMLLADHGARVIRIERPGGPPIPARLDPLARGRAEWRTLNLKSPAGRDTVLALAARADALIEGFRPGVIERLGLAPARLHAANPRLVIGRMTGWGQSGPLAQAPGHDINYLALSGVLGMLGRAGEPPVPPANLIADYGGGGMLLAFAVVAGVLHARASGRGCVIDCAMTEGAALLAAAIDGFRAAGLWGAPRGGNFLDGGAPFYRTYACADGGFVAVGAIEPQFWAALLAGLGLEGDARFAHQHDHSRWPAMAGALAAIFATRPRDAWAEHFAGREACVTPVLAPGEARSHPHALARGSFRTDGPVPQPAPAPRFSAPA
jgi:alpha-methylacyl-CoA racemase